MPKFSFVSWNVRQYKGSRPRLEEADTLLTNLDPDIFALIEFRAKKRVRELMFDRFPEYDFALTDSKGGLEVVVGFRHGKFDQVIWTQKRDFLAGNPGLRPGALVSVKHQSEWFNLLFLHTKSGGNKTAYALRRTMFKKIWKLRKALEDHSPSSKANLIALGDLNTMGNGASISGKSEINKLVAAAENNSMRMLDRDQPYTWHEWGKGPRGNRRKLKVSDLATARRSDLDHVLASDELDFVAHGTGNEAIHVRGWQQVDGVNRVNFLWDLSDHSALFGEIW